MRNITQKYSTKNYYVGIIKLFKTLNSKTSKVIEHLSINCIL